MPPASVKPLWLVVRTAATKWPLRGLALLPCFCRLENVVESTTDLTEEKQEVDEKRQSQEKVAGGLQWQSTGVSDFFKDPMRAGPAA